MTGKMGWLPGLIVNPADSSPPRIRAALAWSLSRSSLDFSTSSSAFSAAMTMGGGRALENRYGRDRCRR